MLLLLVVGGTSVWAQQSNSVTNPTGDTWVRTDNTSTDYGSNNTMEMQNNTNGTTDFYGVMQFSFNEPEFGYRISSATLRLTTRFKKGDSQINVYSLDAEVTDASNYGGLETEITSALDNDPIASFNLKGYNQWAPTDGAVVNEDGGASYRVVSAWQNTIDLTSYVKGLATNSFALLLEKPYSQNNSSQIFTKEATDINLNDNSATFVAADLKPQLTVTYEKIYAEVEEGGNKTYCTTLNDAFDAITSSGTITLYDDVTITSICDVNAKTITVVAAKDGVSVSSTLSSSLWLLAGNAASNLTFGSDDHTITINGGNVSNSSNTVEAGNGTTTFKNVIFKDCVSTHNFGITCLKGSGKLYLDNVTFNGCTANDGWGIVFAGNNDLYLQNEITFTDCAAYNIYLENKYARVGDISTTLAKPLTVFYKTPSLGAVILSSAKGGDKSSLFKLMNDNYGIVKNSGHYTDHVLTEAYTTNITSVGAATLMLPFVSKIPAGVAAYTLNYTAGQTYVKATEVTGGTLSANTPVLLNAEAGKYWFINTTNVASATTDDGANHTVGALVGVYTDTYCPADDYLLGVKDEVVAFYHPAGKNTNYIRANRAYLHADGAGARLTVNFEDEEETTGIENLIPALSKGEGAVFDLSGRRVAQPTKGLYIVNGKKVVIK